MGKLISIGQSAKDLGVSKDTIRRLAMEREEIKWVRIGRRVLIPATEIDRLVNQGTGGAK